MKLKKIASLMLAGVMAVSMLAGCNSASNGGNSGEGEGEGEGTTASGYSAMLGEKANELLTKNDLKDVYTFADNADDQKELEKQAVLVSDKEIRQAVVNNALGKFTFNDDTAVKSAFDLDRYGLVDQNGNFVSSIAGLTQKVGEIWIANGDISMDYVMNEIYESCKNAFVTSPKDGQVNGINAECGYTVSVSVVNKTLKSYNDFSGSVNIILVTVTQKAELV